MNESDRTKSSPTCLRFTSETVIRQNPQAIFLGLEGVGIMAFWGVTQNLCDPDSPIADSKMVPCAMRFKCAHAEFELNYRGVVLDDSEIEVFRLCFCANPFQTFEIPVEPQAQPG